MKEDGVVVSAERWIMSIGDQANVVTLFVRMCQP